MAQRRQGEESEEYDLAQEIEQMIEQMGIDMVQPELDQDIDLMPRNQEVSSPALRNTEEHVPRDQGDTKILDENLEVEMHNISFDESHHKVVQSCTVPNPDVHISLV